MSDATTAPIEQEVAELSARLAALEEAAAPAPTLDEETAQALAAPFDATWIEKLPKPVKRNDDNKGRCEPGSYYTADGYACGGWHARSVHLDYVGHAGITMRLNSVVGPGGWTLEPVATSPDGVPLIPPRGEFWARLTIRGVTHVDVAANYNGVQEAWGDALRRTAMRFGIGTYLWAKSEFAAELAAHKDPDPREQTAQELADRIDAGVTLAEFDEAAEQAKREGLLAYTVRVGDVSGPLGGYLRQARPHVEAHDTQEAPAEAASAPQTPQEPPAQAPAPENPPQEPQQAPDAPQGGPPPLAVELARAALEEGTVAGLGDVYRMAQADGILEANVIAVIGDDDLAALGVDPRQVGDTIPLGGLLMRARGYVERHGNAVRDLGEPDPQPAERRTSVDEHDPWASDPATENYDPRH